jgi:hypothetical protein
MERFERGVIVPADSILEQSFAVVLLVIVDSRRFSTA